MVSKFHRNSVVRGDETRGKRSFPPPMNPLSISRLFHQRALLERATRVLYVCFSFPVEKSLIIGHGNAKWAEGYFSLLRIYNALVQSTNPFIPSFPLHLKTSFFTTTVTILVLIKKRGGKKGGERNHEDSLSGANNAVPRFPLEYFITKATVTAIINGYSRE